ncbi:MAG: hypothetical protein ICV68_06235 [Pyrinomonadaceae bacterium]|nr:hypothetical protein [Pyrinomonadaceae bacterium]
MKEAAGSVRRFFCVSAPEVYVHGRDLNAKVSTKGAHHERRKSKTALDYLLDAPSFDASRLREGCVGLLPCGPLNGARARSSSVFDCASPVHYSSSGPEKYKDCVRWQARATVKSA